MVDKGTVLAANAAFASQHHRGRVCVFAGATSGISYGTLRKIVTMLHSSSSYILGRSPSRFATKLNQLKTLAPTYTSEHLEASFAVSYYSRLRLVFNLLPLLRNSCDPRVLSISHGTQEKRINEEDLGLGKKWSISGLVNHTTICTSLSFDYLAADGMTKSITFLHATPGFVNTGKPRTTYPSRKDGAMWWAFPSVMQVVSGWIIRFFGFSLEESGEDTCFT
ncbi:Uu.00g067550.m01.CDS01 [Anthostomella pinea]|uniref:Uu.00g067550.m01.CDS01 n=1 Tax=Anthostomella pinea TaxID=933095 RepID=A0AAI8VV06_9PEZI|nr:Uu.00g067550.m01.CDS01 [Anthostomella pinea]